MYQNNRFDISQLKGRLGRIRDWLSERHLPAKVVFIILGVLSTIWFLIRVIPKPSRASYPCMKVAAPFMSGFVLYLLALAGLTAAYRKTKLRILNVRYASVLLLVSGVVITMAVTPSANIYSHQEKSIKTGPDDGPNQPVGKGTGVNPGRVVWVWNPKATNEECINAFELYKPENTNQGVVNKMVVDGVKKLSGKTNLSEAWDAMFRSFNRKKNKEERGYRQGEKIFIKINQGTANAKLRSEDINKGFYIPERMTGSENAKRGYEGTCETYPNVVLELLRELVNVVGIDQKDITIGDPISHIFGHNYDIWATEFPDIIYADRASDKWGRTIIKPTEKELLYYSDKNQSDKLYDVIEKADYMINVANLKPHGRAGISLTAKNHFGSHGRPSAFHLHNSLISPVSLGNASNSGYGKYRVMVDIMGSRYLGQNTLLFIVDGLYGGGSNETKVPVRYFMPPFNNDWCNSIFLSQDQVALESVCYDFLRSEWNGTYTHSAANNAYETIPNVNGVDDYLHQAADPAAWPTGIKYDPDNSGKPLGSLGVHEHWNNQFNKQYSGNLGRPGGIELLAIPDTLVNSRKTTANTVTVVKKETEAEVKNDERKVNDADVVSVPSSPAAGRGINLNPPVNKPFGEGFTAQTFYSVEIDDDNTKWFLTDAGIVSYDGKTWTLHNRNRKVPASGLNGFAYDFSSYGPELWIATSQGAAVATLPVDARTGATTYHTENSTILSDNVLAVAVGKDAMRWFGTDKGISGFRNKKWLTYSYQRKYPESLFKDFPITAMAASNDGDSLYVATEGAGVARVFRTKTDAISGASEYAQWGPIEIPSDKVYSICIAPDGTQWFGTDMGAARHKGFKTLENWSVFNTGNGLVNNFVRAIAIDSKGNVWLGTKGGISIFDGTTWTTVTEKEGLPGNNILCIKCDRQGVIWIGTDKGVISVKNNTITRFIK